MEQDQYNEIPVHADADRRLLQGPTLDEEPQEVNACCAKENQLRPRAGSHIDSPTQLVTWTYVQMSKPKWTQ